jgi:hypothetical protein
VAHVRMDGAWLGSVGIAIDKSLDSEGVRHSDRRSRTVDSERAARLRPQHDEPVQSRDFRRRHADNCGRHGDRSCGGQRRKRGTGHSCCTRCSGRNAGSQACAPSETWSWRHQGCTSRSDQQFEIQSHPIRPLLKPAQARQCRPATGRAWTPGAVVLQAYPRPAASPRRPAEMQAMV